MGLAVVVVADIVVSFCSAAGLWSYVLSITGSRYSGCRAMVSFPSFSFSLLFNVGLSGGFFFLSFWLCRWSRKKVCVECDKLKGTKSNLNGYGKRKLW